MAFEIIKLTYLLTYQSLSGQAPDILSMMITSSPRSHQQPTGRVSFHARVTPFPTRESPLSLRGCATIYCLITWQDVGYGQLERRKTFSVRDSWTGTAHGDGLAKESLLQRFFVWKLSATELLSFLSIFLAFVSFDCFTSLSIALPFALPPSIASICLAFDHKHNIR